MQRFNTLNFIALNAIDFFLFCCGFFLLILFIEFPPYIFRPKITREITRPPAKKVEHRLAGRNRHIGPYCSCIYLVASTTTTCGQYVLGTFGKRTTLFQTSNTQPSGGGDGGDGLKKRSFIHKYLVYV